jgi:hypothetical protein
MLTAGASATPTDNHEKEEKKVLNNFSDGFFSNNSQSIACTLQFPHPFGRSRDASPVHQGTLETKDNTSSNPLADHAPIKTASSVIPSATRYQSLFTGKVYKANNPSYSHLQRDLSMAEYNDIFIFFKDHTDIAGSVNEMVVFQENSARSLLLTCLSHPKMKNHGRAAIELTRLFISYGVDLNRKGIGKEEQHSTLLGVMKLIPKISWTKREISEVIRLMIVEGGADVLETDKTLNDALKNAVMYKLDTSVVQLIVEKATEGGYTSLFTSQNNYKPKGQTVLELAIAVGNQDNIDYLNKAKTLLESRRSVLQTNEITSKEKKFPPGLTQFLPSLDDARRDHIESLEATSEEDNSEDAKMPLAKEYPPVERALTVSSSSTQQFKSTTISRKEVTPIDSSFTLVASKSGSRNKEGESLKGDPKELFSKFKNDLFFNSRHKDIFNHKVKSIISEARYLNDLIPRRDYGYDYRFGRRVNALYTSCIRMMIHSRGEAVVEMTRLFAKYSYDFNLKGEGENTRKPALMFVIKVSETCNWTKQDITNIVEIIVNQGKPDLFLTDETGNDALKLALRLKMNHEVIKIITDKAVETDSDGRLFISFNKFGKTAFMVAEQSEASKETIDYLMAVQKKIKRNIVHDDLLYSKFPLLSKFHDWRLKYPMEFDVIIPVMKRESASVNTPFYGTPLLSACLERLMSATKMENMESQNIFEASLSLTRRFIELGVDLNQTNYCGKSILMKTISLRKQYPFSEIFHLLIILMLENGADVTVEDKFKNNSLKEAILQRYPLTIIQKICEFAGEKEVWLLRHSIRNIQDHSALDVYDIEMPLEVKAFLTARLEFLIKTRDQQKEH